MSDTQVLQQQCAVLKGLDPAEINGVVQQAAAITTDPGQALFNTGDNAEAAYIVVSGRLATVVPRDWGEDRILEEFGVGELFGEVELLNGDTRSEQRSSHRTEPLSGAGGQRLRTAAEHPRMCLARRF